MTLPLLLGWIGAVLLLQLATALGLALWRRARSSPAAAVPAGPPAESAAAADAAWAGWRDFRVARREFADAASTQCSFVLEPVDGLPLPPFKPGQFLTFQLPAVRVPDTPEGTQRSLTRCYSLSAAPDPAHYRITVKRVPAPAGLPGVPAGASSNHFHDHVQAGDVLRVRAPAGHFHLDMASDLPVVLVGGGIGITPMLSMLGWLQTHQPHRPVHLFHGVRCGHEQAYAGWLRAQAAAHPALRLHAVYTQPASTDEAGRDYQHAGRVDIELLRRMLPHGRHQFYVCGPPAMMDTLVPALHAWGVPPQDVHFEAFGPASVKGLTAGAATSPAATATTVAFRRSGRHIAWDGSDATLLDFAERHGVVVDSGCRSGACGACETRVLEGDVRYASAPDHTPAAGHCLLCVGRPAGALTLDA